MQVNSYEDAIRYLESFIGKVIFKVDPESIKLHPPLDRMKVFLKLLDNPQEKLKSVLVGGTSGKGSTAYLISHILTAAGYKTGLTISPHLQKINERIQINGKPISDEKFTGLLTSILSSIEGMKKMEVGGPSYFEILIAMAFLYFADQKVDIVVVEVGMGGEFDATNTLYPLVAVLTNVSLDHTNILGGTVQRIAATKVGIIKKYQISNIKYQINTNKKNLKIPIVVTGVKQPSVIKIVEDRCKEVGAELYRLGKDLPAGRQGFDFKIKKESLEGSVFDLTTDSGRMQQLNNLKLSLFGKYQVENAALAIKVVLKLKKFGFKVSKEQIRKALKTAFFPGRFEIISLKDTKILRYKDIKGKYGKEKSPSILISQYPNISIVLDGAHNPTKMKAFLATLKDLFPKQKKIFVVAFKFDKDIVKMLKQITKVAGTFIITEFHGKTDVSVTASEKAESIKYQVLSIKYSEEIIVEKDSKKALDKALNISVSLPADATHQALQAGQYPNIPAIIVVTGSLYLVGEVRSML